MQSNLSSTWAMVTRPFGWLPHWLGGVIVLLVAVGIALALYGTVVRVLLTLVSRNTLMKEIAKRTRALIRAGLIVILLGIALPITGFPAPILNDLGRALLFAVILLLGWGVMIGLDVGSDIYLRRFHIDVADNLLARKHVTQVKVLRRALNILIGLLTISIALMTFPMVRAYGVSLFASAGAAGLIVGLAARPLLTNLIAGVQIAITQPIRLEDAVIVEGEWGWIEEITSTYVVIRIWDWRRLIVPLAYFIEKPFQNWTRESGALIGSVHLFVDYTVPIEGLRSKVAEFAKESKLWDGQVVNLQVVEATQNAIQLRVLASARNSGEAWDLRCEIREKLISYLQREYPGSLPRLRAELTTARSPANDTANDTAAGTARTAHAPTAAAPG